MSITRRTLLDALKDTVRYSLFALNSTGELHLYEAHQSFSSCIANRESECGQAILADSDECRFSCLTEEDARIEMAKIGRQVCGNCVSTLYADK